MSEPLTSSLPSDVQAQIAAAVQAALSAQAEAIAAANRPVELTPTQRVEKALANRGHGLGLQEQLSELYSVLADIRGGA